MSSRDRQVFVDTSGRRKRNAHWIGAAAAAVLGGYLVLVAVGLLGSGPVGSMPWVEHGPAAGPAHSSPRVSPSTSTPARGQTAGERPSPRPATSSPAASPSPGPGASSGSTGTASATATTEPPDVGNGVGTPQNDHARATPGRGRGN